MRCPGTRRKLSSFPLVGTRRPSETKPHERPQKRQRQPAQCTTDSQPIPTNTTARQHILGHTAIARRGRGDQGADYAGSGDAAGSGRPPPHWTLGECGRGRQSRLHPSLFPVNKSTSLVPFYLLLFMADSNRRLSPLTLADFPLISSLPSVPQLWFRMSLSVGRMCGLVCCCPPQLAWLVSWQCNPPQSVSFPFVGGASGPRSPPTT